MEMRTPDKFHSRRSCRLCNNDQYTPVYYLDEVEIARCNNCGFIQISAEHSLADLKRHYAKSQGDRPTTHSKPYKEQLARTSKFRADYFQKYTGLTSGSVLEVGSAEGSFLEELKKRGFDVTGVDPSASSLRAKAEGIPVYNELLENVDLPDSHFEAICMFQVLEHFEYPKKILTLLHAKIKKGGFLVLETPDIYSIGAKFEKNAHKLFHKEHICCFSLESLNLFLTPLGFSNIVSRHCDYDGLRMSFAKAIKKILTPIVNPGYKGPLEKILNKEIDIHHISCPTNNNQTKNPKQKPLKYMRKLLSAPLDILFSNIAYLLDRGASLYWVGKKL